MAEAKGEFAAAGQNAARPTLAERFIIDPFAPLSAFDRPSAEAFAAHDPAEPDAAFFALVGTRGLPIRAAAADALAQAEIPGLLPLLGVGVIDWPPHNARRIAFVYRRPRGSSLKSAFALLGDNIQLDLVRRLLQPVSLAMHRLSGLGIAHRGLRPDNIWFADGDASSPALGCALTGPPGYDQPPAFEPIERATAAPAGRGGEVSIADDIYALGATLLALATAHQSPAELGDAQLLATRIEKGSYAALSENRRVPLSLIEPLRGMMADEPGERWSLRDLDAWLDARRTSVRVVRQKRSAMTPLSFTGKSYRSPRLLALALAGQVPEAARAIRDGVLYTWLHRDLREPALAKALADLVAGAPGRINEPLARTDDALVAQAIILLDRGIAIRYRGAAFLAEGFATALAAQMIQGGSVQAMAEALTLKLPEAQIAAQTEAAPDDAVIRQFRAWTAYLKDTRFGFGIERCLYEANPRLPCLSPLLMAHCVCNLPDLIPALDSVASSATTGSRPIDRHLAAFIAARATQDVGKVLADIGGSDAVASALGTIGMLAWLQSHHGGAPAVHLAGWVARALPPVLDALRHRRGREALNREVQRWVARGDLPRLHGAVTDAELWRHDRDGFRAAMATYAGCASDIAGIENDAPGRRRDAYASGVRLAAGIGCAMAIAAVCMTIFVFAA